MQLIRELNELRKEEQKLKISVRKVQDNSASIYPHKGSHGGKSSSESFLNKRTRVQSAVNNRGREIAQVRKEKEEMDQHVRVLDIEFAEIKARNLQLREEVEWKRQ